MNYRHAFHAGNFADVVKHLALVSILAHLRRKPAAFAAIDTHAGRGLYELGGSEAQRSGEAASGIARLLDMADGPQTLGLYLDLVRGLGAERYPGSPLIAAKLLREQDRLVAVEKHPEDLRALAAGLAPFRKARAVEGDGYARLAALLPPPERRGLILIDPPYEGAGRVRPGRARGGGGAAPFRHRHRRDLVPDQIGRRRRRVLRRGAGGGVRPRRCVSTSPSARPARSCRPPACW